MYCHNCGADSGNGAFCGNCGTPLLQQQQPQNVNQQPFALPPQPNPDIKRYQDQYGQRSVSEIDNKSQVRLGIVNIIMGVFSVFVGLAIGIVALCFAKRAVEQATYPAGKNRLLVAKILNIVGIVYNSIFIGIWLIYGLVIGLTLGLAL